MQDVHKQLVDAARAELEAAGNPAYVVALVDEQGRPHWSPMIFSAARAAREQAARLESSRRPGERIAVVARQAEGRRALFTVFDETVERGLHRQLEVVEASFAERDLLA